MNGRRRRGDDTSGAFGLVKMMAYGAMKQRRCQRTPCARGGSAGAFPFLPRLPLGLLLVAAIAAIALPALPQSPRTMDRTVAQVDRELITARDLLPWIFEFRLVERRLALATDEELSRVAISDAVDEKLLYQWAQTKVEEVPESAVTAVAENVYTRYERVAGGPRKLRQRLEQANLSEAALRQFARDRARAGMMIRAALEPQVSNAGVRDIRDPIANAVRVRIATIVLEPRGRTQEARAEALERALVVRRDLDAGMRFEQAALFHSDDKATAENGGEIGWVEMSALSPEVRDAIAKLRGDEATQPIATDTGYQLLRVLDYETPARIEYAERFRKARNEELARQRIERDVRLAEGYKLRPLEETTPAATAEEERDRDTEP